MGLAAKPDWESCKQRYLAWWEHEDFGRAGIWITAPNGNTSGKYPDYPEEVAARWTDKDFLCRQNDYVISHAYYGGEAFPIWSALYPWDCLPPMLGCGVTMVEDTGWWHPCMDKGELSSYNPADIYIRPDNPWYQMSKEYRAMTVEHSMGRAVPFMGAFGGAGDTLAGIRSSEQLMMDIADDPDTVLAFEMRMMELWCENYNERYADLQKVGNGTAGWFQLWSPRKFYAAECDVGYMVSTADFEHCFLPAIEMQTRFLDHTVHHVDGIGNFRHVDALCSLPKLQALQILPGAGKPSPLYYADTLTKVQRAGKNLHITIEPEEVKLALDMLSSRGLMIETHADSREEAEELIRYVEKNSVVR